MGHSDIPVCCKVGGPLQASMQGLPSLPAATVPAVKRQKRQTRRHAQRRNGRAGERMGDVPDELSVSHQSVFSMEAGLFRTVVTTFSYFSP